MTSTTVARKSEKYGRTSVLQEMVRLQRENRRLAEELEQARTLLALHSRFSQMLGISCESDETRATF
jgi:hypothetical protein